MISFMHAYIAACSRSVPSYGQPLYCVFAVSAGADSVRQSSVLHSMPSSFQAHILGSGKEMETVEFVI